MLATGIQAPVPLEELEIHLREEIERHLQSGLSEKAAFEMGASQIGPAHLLKTEFTKARRWFDPWNDDPQTRTQRRLAALWFICRSYELLSAIYVFYAVASYNVEGPKLSRVAFLIPFGAIWCVLGTGIAGSILLFLGKNIGRWIIRTFALFSVTIFFGETVTGGRFSIFDSAVLILSVISIWLLRPPPKPKLASH